MRVSRFARRERSDLVQNIVRKSLLGELSLYNDPGAVAAIRFAVRVDDES
jgi:hypothetical protein